MAPLDALAEVDAVLERLIVDGYARRLERRPGQKEERYAQVLGAAAPAAVGGGPEGPGPGPSSAPGSASVPAPAVASLAERVSALEAEVAELREALTARR